MASVAIVQQPSDAVVAMSKILAPSKLELSRPFTNKIRRIITNETDKLIKTRADIDDAIKEAADRGKSVPKSSDCLSREDVLKLSDALTRRETEHLRLRNKLIEKRKQLYKWDPSAERRVDLELLEALQWNFKRNLNTCLSVREQLLRPHGTGNTTSTNRDTDDKDVASCKIGEAPGLSSKDADVEKDGSPKEELEGARSEAVSILDGAFDDFARSMTQKRKASDEPSGLKLEKERRKKARKERTADKKQTTSLDGQDLQSSLLSLGSQENPDSSRDKAAIDSMSQNNKQPHANDKKARARADEPQVSTTTATNSSHDTICLAKSKGTEPKAIRTQSSIVKISGNTNEPLIEPWYKLHARAMMDPDFDDLVFHRPRRNKRPHSDVYVHGALRDLRDVVSDNPPIHTPPLSSPSISSSCSTECQTGKVDKPLGETNRRKIKAKHSNKRKKHRPSLPEPTTVSSPTQTVSRSVQKASSNALSAS